MLGGLGPCGLPVCCATFLRDFQPISIKMAKKQNLSLNPSKISGLCGRLMCCLRYEAQTYKELKQLMPNIGTKIELEMGKGKVVDRNLVKHTIEVDIGTEENLEINVEDLADYDLT